VSAGDAIAAVVVIGAGAGAVYMASRYRRATPAVTYVTYEPTQSSGSGGKSALLSLAAPFIGAGIDGLFSGKFGNLFGGNKRETVDQNLAQAGGIFSGGGVSRGPVSVPQTRVTTPTAGTANPGPYASSGMGPNGVDFDAYERKYGLPGGYLKRTAEIESGMNPNAKNPRSSAGGLFQFINATAKDYGLTNRYDAEQATDAAARLARDNMRTLTPVLGRAPTGAELYLAHQQGGGGARKILRDPNARATSVVGSAAVKLNGGNSNMSAGDFANLWLSKFNKGAR
tara:strand:- start:912 stop:1763 length:852 start_codon:yes stop_codon:yes gene_type:complete